MGNGRVYVECHVQTKVGEYQSRRSYHRILQRFQGMKRIDVEREEGGRSAFLQALIKRRRNSSNATNESPKDFAYSKKWV